MGFTICTIKNIITNSEVFSYVTCQLVVVREATEEPKWFLSNFIMSCHRQWLPAAPVLTEMLRTGVWGWSTRLFPSYSAVWDCWILFNTMIVLFFWLPCATLLFFPPNWKRVMEMCFSIFCYEPLHFLLHATFTSPGIFLFVFSSESSCRIRNL